MLPEVSPGLYHCGTSLPGYLYGKHPNEIGKKYKDKPLN